MSGQYMSGSVYSASLSAALNDYWQTLERRWNHDAGQTLRGGTSQIDAAPSPARWQVPVESRGHLTTCPIVAWAINDGTPATRPSTCDGWNVQSSSYVECRAGDVFSQVGDWAWAKREQFAAAIPDLAGGPELSSLDDAHESLVDVQKKMYPGESLDSNALPGVVNLLSGEDKGNNWIWLEGWTGIAAESLKTGFLASIGPTMKNQHILVKWLANCYSSRATTIHATRNNTLHLIARATGELFEAAAPSTETSKELLAVDAVSQVWDITSTVIEAIGNKVPTGVGTTLALVQFALSNIREGKPNENLRYPQLSEFFGHLDTAVRTLHSELDAGEADYQKAITAIEHQVAGVDRSFLALYDFTHPPKHGSSSSTPPGYKADVVTILDLARLCYDAAEQYSGLLSQVATVSYADGQLVGRGVVPIAADTALIALRTDVESFFQKTTERYLTAADRITKAAEKYAESDQTQKGLFDWVMDKWKASHEGGYGQRGKIDLDPRKDGFQN